MPLLLVIIRINKLNFGSPARLLRVSVTGPAPDRSCPYNTGVVLWTLLYIIVASQELDIEELYSKIPLAWYGPA